MKDAVYTVRSRKKSLNPKNRKIFIVLMLSVPIAHWLVFWLYVNLNTILLAFQTPRGDAWTLNNFVQVWDELTRPGGTIGIAVKNTLLYFLTTNILLLFLNLIVAYFLYKRIAFYKVYRIVFYLPAIVSAVAITTVFSEFIKPTGPFGKIMELIGHPLREEGLLGNPATATPTIIVYCIWTGFTTNVLMLSSSFSRIPIELLESSRLDGCGPVRELFNVILPLIWPMLSIMLIFAMTGIFGTGGPILLFTNGDFETSTIAFWIFSQVYGTGAVGGTGTYGLVSAAGLCFTAVGVPLILLSRWLLEKIPTVEY